MEHGKLSVTKSKKGKIVVIALIEGKKIPIQNSGITDMSLDAKIVEFEREKGQVIKAVCEGNTIYSKEDTSHSVKKSVQPRKEQANTRKTDTKITANIKSAEKPVRGKLEMKHIADIQYKAKAPYNFIPLNEKIAEAEPIPDFDQYHLNRYTGWIDLEITTRTPLYIRDTLNEREMKEHEEAQKKEKRYINSDFFSPGGKPKIPGSSIRGMIRTLMEIMSHGQFGAFDNKGLYFRGLADQSNLHNEYQSKMNPKDKQTKKPIYKMSAGFIFKRGLDYFIRPAPGFKQITKEEAKIKVEKSGQSYKVFNFYQVDDGWVVVSGPMQGKKKEWFIYPATSDDSFLIPNVDILNYKNDTNRSDDAPNLLNIAGKIDGIPCFYVRWGDSTGKDRVSFGHTGMFRLAYEKSVDEHIPEYLRAMEYELGPDRLKRIQNAIVPESIVQELEKLEKTTFSEKNFSDTINKIIGNKKECRSVILKHAGKYDISEAIFGNAETFAGRVFFEDAVLKVGQDDVVMKEDIIPKLLQSPKPTTFQHYLVQPSDDIKDRRHYNDNSAIRGNKLYWHKAGNDWIERDDKKRANKNLRTYIKPVKPDTKFLGRIRFENLSKVELGALLFSISLPEGCLHKLGMGKPIGLGSVKITPSLHLSDRKKRYEDLFFEWENDPRKEDNISNFKQAFAEYVLKQIGEKTSNLWETDRMKELETMLNFEKGNALESNDKICYMEIEKIDGQGEKNNEFKNRPILPLPSRVGL